MANIFSDGFRSVRCIAVLTHTTMPEQPYEEGFTERDSSTYANATATDALRLRLRPIYEKAQSMLT